MNRTALARSATIVVCLAAATLAVAQEQAAEPPAPPAPPATPQPMPPAASSNRNDPEPLTAVQAAAPGANEDGWPLTLANPFARLLPRPATLSRGDLVQLTLYGMTGPGVPTPFYLHVDADGSLSVPLAGMVNVDGLTTDRAAAKVSQSLSDANLVRDGVVTIGLVQPAAETGLAAGPIRAGDALMVTVFDLVGPGRRLVSLAMVGTDGQIELPLAGPVKLEGLTEGQADAAVQARFSDKRVLPRATVSVLRLGSSVGPPN